MFKVVVIGQAEVRVEHELILGTTIDSFPLVTIIVARNG
jgi:hypothetical protein